MAFDARTQRATTASTAHSSSIVLTAESLLPDVVTARFTGNTSTLSHPKAPKMAWPERYRQRYRLPANIEEQPF